MKDVRCLLGIHKWRRRQIEQSQYFACARCSKERDPASFGPLGMGGGIS
jgi:hypothetical protein